MTVERNPPGADHDPLRAVPAASDGLAPPGRPAQENPFASSDADPWEGISVFEAKLPAGSERALIVFGVVMILGGAGSVWLIRHLTDWAPLRGNLLRVVGLPCFAICAGFAFLTIALQRIFGPKVLIRMTKDGFQDLHTNVTFAWSDVRDLRFCRETMAGFDGHPGPTVPVLVATLETAGPPRRILARIGGLDRSPEAIFQAAWSCAFADPAAREALQQRAIAEEFAEGRPMEAVVSRLVDAGLDEDAARRRIASEMGGAAAECKRCGLRFEPTKVQCPECWEKLTPTELPAAG